MREKPKLKWKREVIESILIFLIGGTIQELVIDFGEFANPMQAIKDSAVNGAFWLLMWKGSQYLVLVIDSFGIFWLEQPLKRFIVSITLSIVYVYLAVSLLRYTLLTLIMGVPFEKVILSSYNNMSFFISLGITLTISTFLHGKSFLKEWQNASIRIEQLKTENALARYDALKNQINPHFLFNSLNSLSSLVYDDQAKAVAFIQKLSQVYRYVLDTRDQELVSVSDEMAFMDSYIFLQKIRFGDNLIIDISGKIPAGWVAPLAIQLLVENAIKHNVISENKPLKVSVIFTYDSFEILNTIQEKKEKDTTGIGLENLKARYEFLTKEPIQISRTENVFSVKVPILQLTN